jgi:hypothetical protein
LIAPTEEKLALFHGRWRGRVDPVFAEFAYEARKVGLHAGRIGANHLLPQLLRRARDTLKTSITSAWVGFDQRSFGERSRAHV